MKSKKKISSSKETLIQSKEKIRHYQLAVVQEMLKLSTSAFGLIAALAWNELIRSIIDEYVKTKISAGSGIISLLIYALIVTFLAVFVTLQLNNIAEKLENKKITNK